LDNTNGDITVSGVLGANAITIDGTKFSGSDVSEQDAMDRLDDVSANVQTSPDEVYIRTVSPANNLSRNYAINYVISVPKYMKVWIENVNGTVKVDNMDNEVSISNMNGDISTQDVFGNTLTMVVNGDIDALITLPLNGAVDLETVNGAIDLAVPAGTSAQFATFVHRGTITISNLVLNNEVRTSTSVTGSLGSGQGSITAEVGENGSIDVRGF
jgi:DUF4097 and DUF4098 domain-containing protein YvlB